MTEPASPPRPTHWLTRAYRKLSDPPKLKLDLAKLDEPRIELWANSPERDWYLFRRGWVVGCAIGVGLLGFIAVLLAQPGSTTTNRYWATVIGILAAVLGAWCTMPYWAARRAFRERRTRMAAYRADYELKTLGGVDPALNGHGRRGNQAARDLPLHALFRLNRRQLDAYQEMTRRQQRNAFHMTQAASVVAFGLVVAGVVLTLNTGPTTQDYIVGGLSGLGAALSAFLGHTFYRTHRDANAQLNWYYIEPYATGRLLIAERITETLVDNSVQKAANAETMIKALLAWELPSAGFDRSNGKEPTGQNGNTTSPAVEQTPKEEEAADRML